MTRTIWGRLLAKTENENKQAKADMQKLLAKERYMMRQV